MTNERRENPKRSGSVNLVYFAVYNLTNFLKQQGMGKTINISEGGILLETYEEVQKGEKIFLSLGLKDETIDIEAEIVHLSIKESGFYHTGFSFVIESYEQSESIKKYINLFESIKKQ